MKRLLIISILVAFLNNSNGQTQRLVLYEGFSNASCVPCAQQNPAINKTIKDNISKLVPIKYQVSWPGFDPMNNQNPEDSRTKVIYYQVSGVPEKIVNGKKRDLSTAIIDEEYAKPSPFFMSIKHNFNANFDSVEVECVVKAAQDFVDSNLVLNIAMLESEISFEEAPGANGEKNFFYIMRKMYPDANGSPIKGEWTENDSIVVNLKVPIPKYIYNISKIMFIAFVQNKNTKEVHQAAKSSPRSLQNYLKIVSHNIPIEPGCYKKIDLQLKIKNLGSNRIDSFNIEYGIVGKNKQTFKWSGELYKNNDTLIKLPTLEMGGGTSVVYAKILNPNGIENYPKFQSEIQGQVSYVEAYTQPPIIQDFSDTVFPYTKWPVVSYDEATSWRRDTLNNGCAVMNFMLSNKGQIDLLYLEPVDLSKMTQAELSFDVAYARFSADYSDGLKVQISTNCGLTWSNIYFKSGLTLATVKEDIKDYFIPKSNEWRREYISLNNYAGMPEVLIRFHALSGWGNNLYIDNIKIDVPNKVSENKTNAYLVYPNPFNETLSIEFQENKPTTHIKILNITGKVVYEKSLTSTNLHHINTESLPNGIYTLVIQTEDSNYVTKLVKL